MKAYTRRRLFASMKLGLAAIPFWTAITLAHGGRHYAWNVQSSRRRSTPAT